MSLEQKVEDYIQIIQEEDSYSSLGVEIIEDLKVFTTDLQKPDTSSDKQQENIDRLWSIYQRLPDSFFYNYSQDLLDIILELPCHQIYKIFHDLNILTPNGIDANIKPQSYEVLSLLMLNAYITKVSKKELILYLKAFVQKKQKNLQLRFLSIDLLNYAINHVNKKEAFLPDLLPTFLRLIYETLHKHNKHKARINDQEYKDIPPNVLEYTTNYELWVRETIKKIFETLDDVLRKDSDKRYSILAISKLYDGVTSTYVEDKAIDKNELIIHYYTLFCFDLLWLILEHGNMFLSEEAQLEIKTNVLNKLSKNCPMLKIYLVNYTHQVRLLSIDSNMLEYNKRDSENLPSESYHALTIYNPQSTTYLAIQLTQSIEGAILSSEYKLSLLFLCLDQLFIWPTRSEELKREVMSVIVILLESLERSNQPGYIKNLNSFGTPLDRVLERILDYAGGPVDPKDRTIGLDLFSKIKKVLSEKALSDLLLLIIRNTKNLALSGFLIIEFKSGLANALKVAGGGQEIKDSTSSFLNVNYLEKLFRLIKNPKSGDLKDEYEVITSFVNILMLVYLRYSYLTRNVENYMQLEFKDTCNLFRPQNLGTLLRYAERLIELQKRISDDIEVQKRNIAELEENKANEQTLTTYQMKFYELVMMYDSITRIEDIYKELKLLCVV